METICAGALFSEKWCDENEKKIAVVGGIAGAIAWIPTPPTQFFGGATAAIMSGISILCAY